MLLKFQKKNSFTSSRKINQMFFDWLRLLWFGHAAINRKKFHEMQFRPWTNLIKLLCAYLCAFLSQVNKIRRLNERPKFFFISLGPYFSSWCCSCCCLEGMTLLHRRHMVFLMMMLLMILSLMFKLLLMLMFMLMLLSLL